MVIAIFLLGAAASVQVDIDVLAQAKSGKVLCSNPDVATKSCSSITSYTVSADGSVIETAEVLLPAEQPLTVTMSNEAVVDGGTICGTMDLDDLRRAQIRLDGRALPPDTNALMLQRLETAFSPLVGKRVCDAIRIEGGNLVKYGQVDQVDIKLPGKPVTWVSPNDGYTVKPR